MKRHRHTPEQVVRKLREGERLLTEGKDLTDGLWRLEVSEATWKPLALPVQRDEGHGGEAPS